MSGGRSLASDSHMGRIVSPVMRGVEATLGGAGNAFEKVIDKYDDRQDKKQQVQSPLATAPMGAPRVVDQFEGTSAPNAPKKIDEFTASTNAYLQPTNQSMPGGK